MTANLLLPFDQGDRTMADLLGGKGANLAEMTRLGLPVPHGFTVTTEACRAFLHDGRLPQDLPGLIASALDEIERASGRRLGDPEDPLLVSVRSGARFSMPGMMETVLNVGLTDGSIDGLARRGGDHFAWDCYRRLVQMYGRTVLGVDGDLFEARLAAARAAAGVQDDSQLPAATLRQLVSDFRAILRAETGEDLPMDAHAQLDRAVTAVFESWNGARAKVYRAHEHIPDDLGTAVNVVEMVYGNSGSRSGSGVCFTRNPATGEAGAYGDYVQNAQGEDVVNGSRRTMPLSELATLEPAAHRELLEHLRVLENHYRDLCDVEFTIDDGRLWILQTRVGKRSPAAAFRMACDLADEGVISLDEALLRVDGHQLESLLHPRFEACEGHTPLATGLPASPGASVGEVALTPATAVARAAAGHTVVLVRTETSPDDLDGMLAAEAIVTARGGLTSHAAVVARGLGRTCVTSVSGMLIDEEAGTVVFDSGSTLHEGDVVSVDGSTGQLYAGMLEVRPSTVSAALGTDAPEGDPLIDAVRRLLAHADERRTLRVRTNAETRAESLTARRFGAEGIGLCRTEHMLLGARRALVERVVLNDRRDDAFAEIEDIARQEFEDILRAMDGLPVVVRLLDPPLHEFLPDLTELTAEAAVMEDHGGVDERTAVRLAAVRRWHESNPMLGLRGVRLLTVLPELVDAHVSALVDATITLREEGLDPHPEVMVPLVSELAELALAHDRISAAVAATAAARQTTVDLPIGVMIELPRAALTAGRLATRAEFFSFGTNDLTQTTWGISRDDAETSFLGTYRTSGLLDFDPFTSLDEEGVGELVRMAVERGRLTRPDLELGACGEHAGDPDSVRFFSRIGLDYVSCSPPRVPVARLEAGRATVLATTAAQHSDTR